MSQFWGTHHNKRDSKGRVSIPASFRAELKNHADANGPLKIVLRASHTQACIEAWPPSEFARFSTLLDGLGPLSNDYEDLSIAIHATALRVECDAEGRIVIPEKLVQHAGLGDLVTFLGLGRSFQVWEPAAAERRTNEALARARNHHLAVPPAAAANAPRPGMPG